MTKTRPATMNWKSLTAALAAAALFTGAGAAAVWAQGPWVAPPAAKNVKNPRADKKSDKKELAEAKKIADTNCVSCHGPGGKGDGAAAAALNPKPADWSSAKVAKETDGELFWKIETGRGPMPPWKHLSEKDRWQLVNYLRSLQKK